MVQGEGYIAEGVDAIWFIVDILPVGAEARGARRIVPVQVRVQLPNDLLVHYGFELSGKEGGPGCLLCSGEMAPLVTSCRTQESGPSTLPKQHSRTDSGGRVTGLP